MGARPQRAFELRLGKPALAGTQFGAHLSLLYLQASEPYRVTGSPSRDDPTQFATFPYRRLGARGGLDWDLSPQARIAVDTRVEFIDATLPSNPTVTREDGTVAAVDLHLKPGQSRVISLALGYDHDTRNDPILTAQGDRLRLYGEVGSPLLGGDYEFGLLLAKYQRWWPLGKNQSHVISLHVTGGVVLGDAALFDRFYVGDLNRLISPRALGLVVSTTPSRDFLGTGTEGVRYGEVSGVLELQYAYRLFRSRKYVYGGDIFVGAGLWALAERNNLRVRDRSLYRALPVDLLFDVGLRLDTELGILELSLANGLGRVPL
jgi:outer membrane protein assembly factor BamA